MKGLSILGSTGSVGTNVLRIVDAFPGRFSVVGLAAGANVERLAEQVARYRPRVVSVAAAEAKGALARLVDLRGVRVVAAQEGSVEVATHPEARTVVASAVGAVGLVPTYRALEAGKDVALANKEVLVVAGHLVRRLSGGAGKRLRPVDSEHNALWQCLVGEDLAKVRRIALTASGGALREVPLDALAGVTPQHALAHPTWRMGPKVTIDSATLVNKAYEVIEAHWLYGLAYDRIDVVSHPESLVHALVEYVDGSVKAHLAEPDMRLPIQYALLWDRAPSAAPRFDWTTARALHFGEVDARRYPCFTVVLQTARAGDLGALIGVSAADEIAVERFLRGDIPFTDIAPLLDRGAEIGASRKESEEPALDEIVAIDAAVRRALEKEPVVA